MSALPLLKMGSEKTRRYWVFVWGSRLPHRLPQRSRIRKKNAAAPDDFPVSDFGQAKRASHFGFGAFLQPNYGCRRFRAAGVFAFLVARVRVFGVPFPVAFLAAAAFARAATFVHAFAFGGRRLKIRIQRLLSCDFARRAS